MTQEAKAVQQESEPFSYSTRYAIIIGVVLILSLFAPIPVVEKLLMDILWCILFGFFNLLMLLEDLLKTINIKKSQENS